MTMVFACSCLPKVPGAVESGPDRNRQSLRTLQSACLRPGNAPTNALRQKGSADPGECVPTRNGLHLLITHCHSDCRVLLLFTGLPVSLQPGRCPRPGGRAHEHWGTGWDPLAGQTAVWINVDLESFYRLLANISTAFICHSDG